MNQSPKTKKEYQQRVDQASPKVNLWLSCSKAFLVGGIICTLGQILLESLKRAGMDQETASTITSMTLVFAGALLTGLDVYEPLGKFAGAGSIVPISGFANSIVSPAIEHKKEGYVFGVGAKMFTVAGPVIIYGVASSVLVGIFYYFIR